MAASLLIAKSENFSKILQIFLIFFSARFGPKNRSKPGFDLLKRIGAQFRPRGAIQKSNRPNGDYFRDQFFFSKIVRNCHKHLTRIPSKLQKIIKKSFFVNYWPSETPPCTKNHQISRSNTSKSSQNNNFYDQNRPKKRHPISGESVASNFSAQPPGPKGHNLALASLDLLDALYELYVLH